MRSSSTSLERADLPYLATIAAFFLVFFWRIPILGELPLIGDPFAYTLPMRQVMWDMIRSGTLPLWTPYIFSGYPLLSMAQLGIGYPMTWGYSFLPPQWGETVYVIAPFLFAPLFLYAYVRELGRSRLGALIAGVSFAYGGMMASKLSNGMLPNAVMWLPLFLIALERSRRGRFLLCLTGAAVVYSMSVLTGIGQGIVLTGVVAGAYAVFLSALDFRKNRWHSLRPVGVAAGAAALAIGVAAFQILESLPALRLSVRSELTYELFGQLSLPVIRSLKAVWVPIYYHIESAPFLPPLVMVLALIGAVVSTRKLRDNPQAIFWLALAVISAVLIPGIYSPFYRVLYYIPILNKFRGSSRHTFGFTLGLSVLAAYGWDWLSIIHSRIPRPAPTTILKIFMIVVSLLAVSLSYLWIRDVASRTPILSEQALYSGGRAYSIFKIGFVILSTMLCWLVWSWQDSVSRTSVMTAVFLGLTWIEASMFMTYSWAYPAVPSKWFDEPRRPMEFLTQAVNPSDRIYLRAVGFDLKDLEPDNLDFLNLSARRQLQNIAGYEPLILQRYSRALGDVWLDGVRSKLAGPASFSIFYPGNHVLDLLSTRYIAGYSNLEVSPPRAKEVDGVKFASVDFDRESSWRLTAIDAHGDSLAVVSLLAYSTHLVDGTPVARLTIHTRDGRTIERDLVAGRDTSEWAYQRPDVSRNIRHARAKVFDHAPVDSEPKYDALRFVGYLPLGERVALDYIEIRELKPEVPVSISKVTLVDGANNNSTPLVGLRGKMSPAEISWMHDSNRWEKAYDRDEVLILRNRRALPRAWLTGAARVVSPDEALNLIRGDGAAAFDPRETVLLEKDIPEIADLPGVATSPAATVRVTRFEPNSLSITTRCGTPSILVVSEIDYPGWTATVDGRETEILRADYILRAVPLTAGEHVVEMRYTAPQARRGAVISVCTIALLGVMFLVGRRSPGRSSL